MDFANGRPFRCAVEIEGTTTQVDINANDLWSAWLDALELLRRHGLDHELSRRTLDTMHYKPEPRLYGRGVTTDGFRLATPGGSTIDLCAAKPESVLALLEELCRVLSLHLQDIDYRADEAVIGIMQRAAKLSRGL